MSFTWHLVEFLLNLFLSRPIARIAMIAKIAENHFLLAIRPHFNPNRPHSSFSIWILWQLPILAIAYLGLLAPYFDRPCFRLATPVASNVPRTT
jgi:hypothetical protein